jgi:hypothetical protein
LYPAALEAAHDMSGRFGVWPVLASLTVAAAGAGLALAVLTGAHTYLFHPKSLGVERQNRLIAISYYACAPLALLPFSAALVAACMIIMDSDSRGLSVLGVASACAGAGVLLLYWWALFRMARRTMPVALGAWKVAILVPLLWLLGWIVFLAVFPALALYGAFMIYTLV